ncbi:hypothetical protein RB601_005291 [Gaeumannomyces tritici]
MIRYRVARSQDSQVICAACALALRVGAIRLAQQPTARHHRWYSVADAPRPNDDGPRPGESSDAPANPSSSSQNSGFASRPITGKKLFGQRQGQARTSTPRLVSDRDDFLLPHELAARQAALDERPRPPPPEQRPPPPEQRPPPLDQSALWSRPRPLERAPSTQEPQARGRSPLPLGVGFEPVEPLRPRNNFGHTGPRNPPSRPDIYPRKDLGPARETKLDGEREWSQLSRPIQSSGDTSSTDFVPMQQKNPWAVGGLGFLASKLGEEKSAGKGKGFGSILDTLRNANSGASSRPSTTPPNQPRRAPTFGRPRDGDNARAGVRPPLDLDDSLLRPFSRPTNATVKPPEPADEEDFFSQFDKKTADNTRPRQFERPRPGPAPVAGDDLFKPDKQANGGPEGASIDEDDFFRQFDKRNSAKPAPSRPKSNRVKVADFPMAENIAVAKPAPVEPEESSEWAKEPAVKNTLVLDSAEHDVVEERWSRRRERPEKTKTKPKNMRRRGSNDEDGWDEETARIAEERRLRKEERQAMKEQQALERLEAASAPKPILVPEFITVANLGEALGFKTDKFLEELTNLGFEEITDESVMTGETAALVAQEFDFEPTIDDGHKVDLRPRPAPEDPSLLPPRPPIVTIMGHVDHGKTTMLDWLRKSSIAAGEHGGITQHIGAFSVCLSTGKQITFLDTPGHAAFLTMRQRGANITDIVILVVAADDSVKPQTLEALKHAQNAKVPIIVAINKADKPEARVEQVKFDIANNGVELEQFGGEVQAVAVSGKTGLGMKDLEESIVTLAEVLDMRAELDGMAEGWILESGIKPLGRAATVLVKRGTLRKGDIIVAGSVFAKIRFMMDEFGKELKEAPPGTPVEVFGWRDAPLAGDQVLQAPDEDKARQAIKYRVDMAAWQKTATDIAEQERRDREKAEADALAAELAELGETGDEDGAAEAAPTGPKIVNFVIRGDALGSVEAVMGAIMEIGNNDVRARVLRSNPGQVSESDVEHAATTGSAIINFNSPIPAHIQRLADASGVRVLDYSVIYHLVDAVKALMSEQLPEAVSYKVLGEAELLEVFPINIRGRVYKNIAGCRVRNGQLLSNGTYRVMRGKAKIFDGKAPIYPFFHIPYFFFFAPDSGLFANPCPFVSTGKLESLKHGRKEVTEIKKGSECGIGFDGFQDLKVGDQIQMYETVREKQYL